MTTPANRLALAAQYYGARQFARVEQICRQIVELEPGQAEAWCLLGAAQLGTGAFAEATASFQEALRWTPDYPEAHNNLGIALDRQGLLEPALASYQQALRLRPTFAEAAFNLGHALERQGRAEEALVCYRQAVELRPDYAKAVAGLGSLLGQLGRLDEAVAVLERAAALRPDHAATHNALAVALIRQRRLEAATAAAREAVRLRPDDGAAHHSLGRIAFLQAQQDMQTGPGQENPALVRQQLDAAAAHYRQALAFTEDNAEVHYNLSLALFEGGDLAGAVAHARHALRQKADYAEAEGALGKALAAEGRLEEAAAALDRAVQLRPGDANLQGLRALHWLQMGRFELGWPEYEWRWRGAQAAPGSLSRPVWDGSPLSGRTILLHAEQGLGDTLQFIRYAALVRQRGGRVVVECPRPLLQILACCAGIDQLVAHGEPLPTFDVHAPLLSLPRLLGTTLATVPANVPYVYADAGLVEQWRQRLASPAGFKIGINWRGRTSYREEWHRAVPLAHFEALARLPGVRLVSLQKGSRVAAAELRRLGERVPVTDLGGDLDVTAGAFMDTAAVMRCLDLVISSDTAVAHLAGALGVPVWLALPLPAEWRWLWAREDSPWYPSMRLFRQPQPGAWDAVFERIASEVAQLLGSRR
jgi:tetratricopeptide (TPR) repeat protein